MSVTAVPVPTASLPTPDPFSSDAIGSSATRHGAELSAAGCSVSQVVHDYGDICQAITEIALEQHAPITVEEFHTLNRCLDTAIAEAVTEHTRLTAQTRSHEEVERLGQAAHDRSGLGLGLSIARQAVRAHSGDIRVRSMPGKGCVFTIDVPSAPAEVAVPQRV